MEKICSTEGCDKVVLARQLCMNHYQQWWIARKKQKERNSSFNPDRFKATIEFEKATKLCIRCKTVKPLDLFGRRTYNPNLLRSHCRECEANAGVEKHRQQAENNYTTRYVRRRLRQKMSDAEKKEDRRAGYKRAKLLQKYNLTMEQYEAILEAQNFVCKICKIPFTSTTKPHVDHCHSTSVVRGILCHLCNLGLGAVRDDIEILESMKLYLIESQQQGRSK